MGGLAVAQLVERLSMDFGWRWVVGLAPADRVWFALVIEKLVSNESEFIERLVEAAGHAIEDVPRSNARLRVVEG